MNVFRNTGIPSGDARPYVLLQITPAEWVPTERELDYFLGLLGPSERQRLARLAPRKRREFLVSRALLRCLLSAAVGQTLTPEQWTIEELRDLPPRVDEASQAGLYFSISHSAGVVAIAVSRDVGLGVDIERMKPRRFIDLAESAFHPDEGSHLQGLAGEALSHAFYRLWTLGEASLKLREKGLGSGALAGLRVISQSAQERSLLSGVFTILGEQGLAVVCPCPVNLEVFEAPPFTDLSLLSALELSFERVCLRLSES